MSLRVSLPPGTESPAVAVYWWDERMAAFLDSLPSYSNDFVAPIVATYDQGETLRTVFGDRGCASVAQLILPVGARRVDGVVGWLHPAVLYEVDEIPFYVIGGGQPVTIGPRYLYVPSGSPGNVVRAPSGASGGNPYILWGFWRSRYFGPLSIRVSDWT